VSPPLDQNLVLSSSIHGVRVRTRSRRHQLSGASRLGGHPAAAG
jgi:hypothetical protein